MKLIIQIPCYNEEKTLPVTLRDLPKKIPGIDSIEVLIINDGSDDKTGEVARGLGVNHMLNLPNRQGLATVFKKGLDRSLEFGADIIVNTDGDNQYCGKDIENLVRPILEKRADIVIGCRDIKAIKHFSFMKKVLQAFGSRMVKKLSRVDIPDATSGFRAYARDAALKLNIFSTYTYTVETIIQAGKKGIPMTHVPIRINDKLRESRLIKNIPSYIMRSIATMLRIYMMYEPLKTFLNISLVFVIPGLFFVIRFLYFYFSEGRSGHVQSMILAAILILMGAGIALLGLLGDIISANRKLSEEMLYRIRKEALK